MATQKKKSDVLFELKDNDRKTLRFQIHVSGKAVEQEEVEAICENILDTAADLSVDITYLQAKEDNG